MLISNKIKTLQSQLIDLIQDVKDNTQYKWRSRIYNKNEIKYTLYHICQRIHGFIINWQIK